MKTLEQIEPRIDLATIPGDANYHHVITNAGSYFLSGNLDVTKAHGIDIRTSGVALDLYGFQVRRTGGTGGNGIELDFGADRCVIRNGSVAGFANGVHCLFDLFQGVSQGGRLESVTATDCTIAGLAAGAGWHLRDCIVERNSGTGMTTGAGCSIVDCVARSNEGAGIIAISSSVSGASASSNQGDGIRLNQGTLAHCVANLNEGSGIVTFGPSTLENCTANANTGTYGIQLADGGTASRCTVSFSAGDYALYAGDGCTLTECTAAENLVGIAPFFGPGIRAGKGAQVLRSTSTANSGEGIETGEESVVWGCLARGNGRQGIEVGSGSSVLDCTAASNDSEGILAGLDVVSVRGCTVLGNGSAGIRVLHNASIVGCTVRGNVRGIDAATNSQIVDCLVSENSDHGIFLVRDCTARNCEVFANAKDGIRAGDGCRLVGNTCNDNSPSGISFDANIHVTGTNNWIQANTITQGDNGIQVDTNANVVVANQAGRNQRNYEIATGNQVGFIMPAPPSGAVSGSSGGAGVGTTDPWANLSF